MAGPRVWPPGGDIPARIVAAAAAWLPAARRDWGRAMAAELAQVHGLADRWRFAAGALSTAVSSPARAPAWALPVVAAAPAEAASTAATPTGHR